MSESVIADFVGTFNSEVATRDEPIQGRVVLSQRRLVLAASESDKLTIPLSSIFDVAVGHVPEHLGDFFKSTVTVGFERNERRFVAAIEADDDTIDKFGTVLFKALLNGTTVQLAERERVGGRVTDEGFRTAAISLRPGAIIFQHDGDALEVDLSAIVELERTSREFDGSRQPLIRFRHMMDGTAVTTAVSMAAPRKMAILGRYLRLEYADVMQDLAELEVGRDETEVVVALYSAAGMADVPLAAILDKEADVVSTLVLDLVADGLIEETDDGPILTRMGEVVACRNIGEVNV